jgi:hypothetical protein
MKAIAAASRFVLFPLFLFGRFLTAYASRLHPFLILPDPSKHPQNNYCVLAVVHEKEMDL